MPVEQLPATAVVPDAVTVASDDPAQAEMAEMAERYLQSCTDPKALEQISKMAKVRAREVIESRKKRRKRVTRWRKQQYRDIAKWAGGIITFQRELIKSKSGRNGLYTLEIQHLPKKDDRAWHTPVVMTLMQPDGSKIIYDPDRLTGANYETYNGEGIDDDGNIHVNRASKMMKRSLHRSNEAVPRFFGMGEPQDWNEERVAEYLQEQKDALPLPPRRAQSYDDAGIRNLELFKTCRKAVPDLIDDAAIIMMVRGTLAKEYAEYQEKNAISSYRLSEPDPKGKVRVGRRLDLELDEDF